MAFDAGVVGGRGGSGGEIDADGDFDENDDSGGDGFDDAASAESASLTTIEFGEFVALVALALALGVCAERGGSGGDADPLSDRFGVADFSTSAGVDGSLASTGEGLTTGEAIAFAPPAEAAAS